MKHVWFIAAAYGLTIVGTIALVWWSYVSMRRSEARAEAVRSRK